MAALRHPTVTTVADDCIVTDEQGNRQRFPRYRHSSLPLGRTIRLLKSESYSLSNMHECSLIEYELENTDVTRLNVSYIAMSYTWGAAIFDAPLILKVRGQRTVLPVTASVWEAVQLTLPRVGMHGKFMWIDQICINQTDDQEKEKQVMLMGDIYRRCWHCMIWLGPADTNTQTAFSPLRRLQDTFPFGRAIPIDERQIADLSHAQIRAKFVAQFGRDMLPPGTDPGWVAIAKLLQRSWFTRLWTFQEGVLCYTGDGTIRCGDYDIEVVTFMRASMFLGNDHTFTGVNVTVGRSALAQISSLRHHVEHGDLTPMVWLLQNNGLRDCHDPRDRVYAFLALRKEEYGHHYPIQVSYTKSAQDLFTEIARDIIRSQESLRICADAPERVPDGGLDNLPSWVPDWTRKNMANTFELLNPAQSYFKASDGRPHVDIIRDSRLLKVKGRRVDVVVNIIDAEVPDVSIEEERRRALVDRVLPLLERTLRARDPRISDAKLAHTIVNTINVGGYTRTTNQGNSGLPPDAWSEYICEQMLFYILNPVYHRRILPPHIEREQWLHALTRQAIQCVNRRFVVLKNNLVGLMPKLSTVNDRVVILHGSSLPFVLRSEDNGYFKMIGACYIDGIMNGERVNWTEDDAETFWIC